MSLVHTFGKRVGVDMKTTEDFMNYIVFGKTEGDTSLWKASDTNKF